MRIASVVAVAVALPVLSFAAPTKPAVIEKLVTQHVAALAKRESDDKLGLAKGAIVIAPGGLEMNADLDVTTKAGAYYAGTNGTITHKTSKPTVGIDDAVGIAYFQAPITVSIRFEGGDKLTTTERAGGIAVRDGETWKVAAAMWTKGVDADAKVIDHAANQRPVELPTGEPAITGDATLGAVVRGWFKGGFAPAAAKKGKRIASGTGPKEFAIDAAAVKMAKSWDKLGLVPTTIEVTQVAGGKAAFAQVQCIWKAKKGETNVPLLLGIVMVPDGADWRWVSMQFSPD